MSFPASSRRPLAAVGRSAAVAAAASLVLACMPSSEAPARWILLARGSRAAIDPGERITGSSRLFLVDGSRPDASPRPLAEGLAAAAAAAVSWDGRRMIFVGRQTEDEDLGLWSVELPGGAAESLGVAGYECGSADLLPDGGIVFSARVEGPSPTPELASRWAIFVLAPDNGEVRRITYGLSEIDPRVLADGRILYSQWRPPGDGSDRGGSALFAVHPDGTGATAVHGFHGGPAWKLRPWQLGGGDLVFLGGEESGRLRWLRVDRRSPSDAAVDFTLPAGLNSAAFGRGDGESVLTVNGEGLFELVDGRAELLVPGIEADEVVTANPRPRPQGHLSMVDPEAGRGQVFGIDARPPGRSDAVKLRVRVFAEPALSEAVLGTVELATDGSFFIEVPADLPLLFDVLDAAGRPVETSTTPLWVRPGEKRGCVGCHEDPHLAPPNRRPLAVLAPPVDLTGDAS